MPVREATCDYDTVRLSLSEWATAEDRGAAVDAARRGYVCPVGLHITYFASGPWIIGTQRDEDSVPEMDAEIAKALGMEPIKVTC